MRLTTVAQAVLSLAAAWLVAKVTRFYLSWRRRDTWMRTNVPFIPSPLLKGGVLPAIADPRRHRTVQQWTRQYGTVCGYRFLWNHTLVVSDPAMAAQVLGPGAWMRHGLDKAQVVLYSRLDFLWDERSKHGSLFTLPTGPHHKLVRRAVAPAFSTENLRRGFPAVLNIVGQLVDSLYAQGATATVDVDAALKREALDVIGKVGFGVDFGATRSIRQGDEPGAVFELMEQAVEEGMKRVVEPFREYTAWFRKDVRRGMQRCAAFRAYMAGVVQQVRAPGPPADDDVSIAAHLLRVQDPKTGQPLSDQCLVAEFSIAMIAGMDTTTHTLAFFLYLVSQHPEVEHKIAEELRGLGLLGTLEQPRPRPLQWDDLPKLHYLGCAMKEGMRLLPTAGEGTFRVSKQDVRLGELNVPAGVFIWSFFLGTFTHPDIWDDPDSFRPERWLDPDCEFVKLQTGSGDGEQQARPLTDESGARLRRFYPFSQGQRGCVGRALAVLNYTTTAATLLGHFTFRLADKMGGAEGVRAAEIGNLTLQLHGGLHMHCVPRATLQ